MAQHDFINKKPGNRNSKKTAPPKKPFPVLLVLVTVLLVGGFSFGLWYVKTNADPKLVEQQANPTPAKVQQELPKPRPPEFIKEIKEHEIQVEVRELEQKGPYVMQCGSFRTHGQAETLKAKIAFAGLIAEIRETTGTNGVWYKVRLGPYKTKRLAESDKNKLKRNKITGCGIWNWT
ncbi:SPOR domain-containing protein [Pseudoalteromonas sp. SR44-5]|uniref:SPOR domain-containing protein n=1 Tax=Pseudoalteromonas rhizosphaerae TaxID=2518973 RepID=A0ABW8KZ07_9GAMM|nr:MULTISPECIES: SPOR domain-containing protein [unclassified Pseudoalteromonas]MBB1342803.1 SPOR domain-containing protein [Pseudoalteromonas sp. SR45-6]MBB1365896.1 SPOR domain-containing protein [Pseudoalteromonas sp. SR44-5]MBB1416223.1 SPOR domain-containing protein [Pseudoalteromonas sp. SG44-1]MBB1434113.1 SPOR domain-containing protein [Pseudoalteromonas sp. SG43-6]